MKPTPISPMTATGDPEREGGETSAGSNARAGGEVAGGREDASDGEDSEELQDGGHSKRRRLREHELPQAEQPGPDAAREELDEDGEEGQTPRTPPNPGKPTDR